MAFGPIRVHWRGMRNDIIDGQCGHDALAGSSLDEPDMSGPAPVYNSVKLIT